MDIYVPAEDSHLLAEAVEKYAFGNVLDMGTGSGIQAETALKSRKVAEVTATDINQACAKNVNQKIKFIRSNLFESVPRQKFDTIIFNPPYLPQDTGIHDERIYGGKKGYELAERFLDTCGDYLAANGIVLLVFSSLTKKAKIDEAVGNNCFEKEILAEKQLPLMERLYAYKVAKSQLLRDLEKKVISGVKKFAEGNRGIIYTGMLRGMKIAVKSASGKSPVKDSIKNEAKWLKLLNKQGIGPKLILDGSNYFVYAFVEGDYILDYFAKSSSSEIAAVLKKVLGQCRTLDRLKINKLEMGRPQRHVIVRKGKPIMLDFERCRKAAKPKNVTQFCQFMASGHTQEILQKKGLHVDRQKLLEAAKAYKKNPAEASFEKIVGLISPLC